MNDTQRESEAYSGSKFRTGLVVIKIICLIINRGVGTVYTFLIFGLLLPIYAYYYILFQHGLNQIVPLTVLKIEYFLNLKPIYHVGMIYRIHLISIFIHES